MTTVDAGEGAVTVPVDDVEASAYTVPTDGPEADGTLTWDSTTLVLVRVSAGGATGTGYTYAPAAAAHVVSDLIAPVVGGRDALDVAASWDSMVRAVRNAGRAGLVGMAISAVDTALWDLCARLRDAPLAALWDEQVSPVPAYGSGGFTTYTDDRLREQLSGWLELGLPRVKIKIGESWGGQVDRDLARVRLSRDVIGPGTELFVDANGGYGRDQAVLVGCALDELGVAWFEEPVSSQDRDGLEHVRRRVDADVAAGEYVADLAGARDLAGVVDCLQLDVTRCGGYTGWRQIAAAGLDVPLSGHCAPYLSLPVAATTPALRHVEYFHDHVRIERRLFDGCSSPADGRLTLSSAPGHGLTFRAAEAEQFRVA